MALIYLGNPLTGTINDDYIVALQGGVDPDTIINAGDGNDVVYGDCKSLRDGMDPSHAAAAMEGHEINGSGSGTWTISENADIANSNTVAHASIYCDGSLAGQQGWISLIIRAGETITLDVDYGANTLNNNTDTVLSIFAFDGVTQIAFNDDGPGDTGSSTNAGGGQRDSYLTHTFASAGIYYVNIRDYNGPSGNFAADDSFILNISLSLQATTGNEIGGDDTIDGGAGNDVLHGMGGSDTMYGAAGNDTVYGGDGNDVIFGGSAAVDSTETGNDILYGDRGRDSIYGNGGNDTIYGGFGADTLIGGTGNDRLYGGLSGVDTDWSDDFMRGGDGIDWLYGDGGDDTMLGGAGVDTLYGGEGNDLLYGGALLVDATDVGDFIYGGNGNDDIRGNGGDDILFGESGDDSIIGGLGNDEIRGGLGNDYLRGGAGADTFIFEITLNAATNIDTIHAFVVNEDRIVLSQAIFTGIGTTLDATEFQIGAAANDIGDRIIYNQATGQLFFDPDGNTLGGAAQTQFAVMTVNPGSLMPALTIADFVMIA
jgi:Ca2+-binding RTX toxin-like protein